MANPIASNQPRRRRRFVPLVWLGSLGALVVVALAVSGTLSGFTASINNSNNTAGSGVLTMQEGDGTTTCLSTDSANSITTNAGTCSTINKFGGSTTMVPGDSVTKTITIKNTGTVNANVFSLTPGATCTQSNNGSVNGTATDFCSKVNVKVDDTTGTSTNVYDGTAAGLAGHTAFSLPAVAAGATRTFTFTVTLDSAAGNSYQGLAASLPLTWAFGQ